MQRGRPQVQPTLTDGVVVLTPFRDEDAPTMVEWDHDAEMARWFDFPSLRTNRLGAAALGSMVIRREEINAARLTA